jgi:hypothetical protein
VSRDDNKISWRFLFFPLCSFLSLLFSGDIKKEEEKPVKEGFWAPLAWSPLPHWPNSDFDVNKHYLIEEFA